MLCMLDCSQDMPTEHNNSLTSIEEHIPSEIEPYWVFFLSCFDVGLFTLSVCPAHIHTHGPLASTNEKRSDMCFLIPQ